MIEKAIYIHYGDDKFRAPNPICNCNYFTKPYGGLWASKKGDELGWKSWCEREEFRLDTFDQSFEFTLKDWAKVLVLENEDQLDALPKLGDYIKGSRWLHCHLDFEKLAQEFDAIELADIDKLYWALYGWDCNSILIMNPDIVEVIREGDHAL